MFCSRENLEKIQQDIQSQNNSVYQQYEAVLRNRATSLDIVNRIWTLVLHCYLVSKWLETTDEDSNQELVKERMRQVLNKD